MLLQLVTYGYNSLLGYPHQSWMSYVTDYYNYKYTNKSMNVTNFYNLNLTYEE